MTRVADNTSRSSALTAGLDAAGMAALALAEDARESKKMVQEARKDAQRDKIDHMRQAAAKLREMASCALGSAILQGAIGLASAACSAASAVSGYRASQLDLAVKTTEHPELAKKFHELAARRTLTARLVGETIPGLLGVAKSVDPFHLQSQNLSADKAEIDVRAEVDGQRAQEQSDFESEARRLEQAAAQQLQKLGESRHAIALAALKV